MHILERFGRLLALPTILMLAVLGGCKTDPQAGASTTAQPLAISGTPPAGVAYGQTYSFQPTVSSAAQAAYSFSVSNKPSWATLSTATGALTGRPAAADVGIYGGIVVTVSSSSARAALPPFSIKVIAANGSGSALTIKGTPATSVGVGSDYRFAPTAADADGDHLGFSIQNKPSWASFDATTGELSGAPTAAETGSYTNILITVTDGTFSASLPMFNITVTAAGAGTGTATLSWLPPTTNTDGTPLTNLAGYRIYYGNAAQSLTQAIVITNTGLTTYVVTNLSAGTWYFAVKSFNSADVESDLSTVVRKTT